MHDPHPRITRSIELNTKTGFFELGLWNYTTLCFDIVGEARSNYEGEMTLNELEASIKAEQERLAGTPEH